MFKIGRFLKWSILLISCFTFDASAQRSASERADWNRPLRPFRIAGNLFYVGARGVSSFLITTTNGSILIDGGLPETAPQIEKNIVQLGFRIEDVMFLLNSHAHFDHAGGLAELKKVSGAQLIASVEDSKVLQSGIDPVLGPAGSFPAVKVDRTIGDSETIQLGGMILTAHLTPGHTRGATTWTTIVTEGDKKYRVVFHSSTTVAANQLVGNRAYPQIVSDYEASFVTLRKLPCDIFLAPHGSFFNLEEKLGKRTTDGPNPFVSTGELRAFVDRSERDFERELKEQQARAVAKE